ALPAQAAAGYSIRNVTIVFLAASLLTGGVISWFASEHPDGLEWSIQKVTGKEEVEVVKGQLHGLLASLQEKAAFLPDYSFKKSETPKEARLNPSSVTRIETAGQTSGKQENVEGSRLGTTVSGILGGLMTLALAGVIGFVLKKRIGPA
ncbi:MAG: PDGLE domain-containing protein, partial [Pseudomonadota bacterium]